MSDLVERLRDKWLHSEEYCYAAADEIERLREALQNCVYALQAEIGLCRNDTTPWRKWCVSVRDKARAALEEKE
jgi:hypothetical protein